MEKRVYISGVELVSQDIQGRPKVVRAAAKSLSGALDFEFEIDAHEARNFHVGDGLLIQVTYQGMGHAD